jgi:hypothetical protein
MEFYAWACEAFEREAYDVYNMAADSKFMATEGAGTWVVTKIKNGWQVVVSLAKQIWGYICDVARAVGTGFMKILGAIKKFPKFVYLKASYAAWVVKQAANIKAVMGLHKDMDAVSRELDILSSKLGTSQDNIDQLREEIANYDKKVEWLNKQRKKYDLDKDGEANESFMADYAMEADEGDGSDNKKGTKVNIGGILEAIKSLGNSCKAKLEANKKTTAKVQKEVEAAASNGDQVADSADENATEKVQAESKKQSAFTALLRIFNKIGAFFTAPIRWVNHIIAKIREGRAAVNSDWDYTE